jgi:streptogramin lyase
VENTPVESVFIEAEIPKSGSNLAFGFNSLWAVRGATLVRVDAANNTHVSIRLEGATGLVKGLAVGEGNVWIPDVGSRTIYKVDPATNQVVQTISAEMFGETGSIGVGEGSIWVVTGAERVLTRFNALTGKVEARIALPGDSAGVAVDFGSAWVTGYFKGEVYRIDPATNTVVQTTRVDRVPRLVISAYGSMWVLNSGSGTVQRIDPESGVVIATIAARTPDACGGNIAAGGGYLWVSESGTPLIQIDASREATIRKFRGAGWSRDIHFGAGSIWISGASIKRIQPPI